MVPVELKIRNGALVWESDGRGLGGGCQVAIVSYIFLSIMQLFLLCLKHIFDQW